MCSIYFDQKPQFVNYRMKTGLTYRYDSPETLGTDRICNAVAAVHFYGSPCIVIDFGTATTFGAVSPENEFMGGIICPSLMVALNALVSKTAMLPNVEVEKPPFAIATNTAGAIQAGAIYGYVGQVEYLLRRMHNELGYKSHVVATGGMAHLIASETDFIDEVNQTLTLEGLNILYGLNN
ncbi:Type III pantothenate kinase [bioreactor metagenome]|uniref:Type III pantothenate kinase n=1 Tax=bioreactor metagenome TaxID=1076179 RepID=A0A645IIR5_9ZZZZ